MAQDINIEYWKYDNYVLPYSTFTNNTPKLTDENVNELLEIASKVSFRDSSSVRRRMGVNGAAALSVYEVAKWYYFGSQNRKRFKAQFPHDKISKAYTGWYLRVPEKGFIDKIAMWVDKASQNIYYFSVALHDGQRILIDDVPHTFNRGDVLWFNLKSTYEIPVTDTEQLWACILVAEY